MKDAGRQVVRRPPSVFVAYPFPLHPYSLPLSPYASYTPSFQLIIGSLRPFPSPLATNRIFSHKQSGRGAINRSRVHHGYRTGKFPNRQASPEFVRECPSPSPAAATAV